MYIHNVHGGFHWYLVQKSIIIGHRHSEVDSLKVYGSIRDSSQHNVRICLCQQARSGDMKHEELGVNHKKWGHVDADEQPILDVKQ